MPRPETGTPNFFGVGFETKAPAGSILRFEEMALRGIPGKATVHQLRFAEPMAARQLPDESPEEAVVLGVQREFTRWGAE